MNDTLVYLGMYWATYRADENDGKLFPGNNQYDRFRKLLSRLLRQPTLQGELDRRGTAASNIGTHSMRKGAATYCSSGSTACPSAIAIHLRAGWALGGVQDRYLRHDGAGDMHVGRTVCGLPVDEAEFAILPPRFVHGSSVVATAKRICFSSLPPSASGVGEYALASLIKHIPMLRRDLPESHPLFQNPLFVNQTMVDVLTTLLVTNRSEMAATGIPPHVVLLEKVKRLERLVLQQQHSHDELVQRLVNGVDQVLENRAVQSGIPTCDRVADTVIQRLEAAGFTRCNTNEDNATVDESVEADSWRVYTWGGRLHEFPRDTDLPSGGVEQAWVYWCCGDPGRQLPPFKRLRPMDFVDKNKRKRLSDFRTLMQRIETRARELQLETNAISIVTAVDVFSKCKDIVEIPDTTRNGRKRRHGQLVWISVETELRKLARQRSRS
jgi:hypothetical protein